MWNKKLNLKVQLPVGVREMTVDSSYHRVMKGLKESAEQNMYLSPGHREQELCSYHV